MNAEKNLWACALLVEREHGNEAVAFIAERVGALAAAGDAAGVERWKKARAAKLDQCRGRGADS